MFNQKTGWLKLYLCTACLLVFCHAGAQTTNPYLEDLKQKFITHVTTGLDAYKTQEIVDKTDDKKAFLQSALNNRYQSGKEAVYNIELFVGEALEPGQWHLGAIALVFSGDQPAEALFSKIKTDHNPAYFSDIKVKTQYLVLRRGATVIVVYSETSSAPKVASFFATLSTP